MFPDSNVGMVSGRGPKTPSGFHFMVSAGVGVWLPACVHRNDTLSLLLLIGLWVGIQVFMHWRAHRARGVFWDEEIELFSWFGAAGFLAGLFMASTFLTVFG
jgi:hypothetical protein